MIYRNTQPSINGFTSPRRKVLKSQPMRSINSSAEQVAAQPYPNRNSGDSALSATKPPLGNATISQKPKFKKRRRFNLPSKRQVKWTIFSIILFLLLGGGIFAWKILDSGKRIFNGNILNAVSSFVSPDKPLKTDASGNSNILVLGTSESDPNHPGAQLTDSIMIISVNKAANTTFLLSIPRDLWVKGNGQCTAGYQYKINAVYECSLSTTLGGLSKINSDEATAETETAAKIGSVVGVNINYTVHMNLAVIQQVVDAVGGIDITIDSPDRRGILDTNFDWRCGYRCNLVKYPNGPAHLTGTNAMWLAQARNDAGGYGLPRSNFDREANQRKVVIATRDKATSIGFLANPLNSINLLNAIGDNIHTTVDPSEIKSFIDLAKDIPSNNIISIDIMNNATRILTTGTGPDGSSIVRPIAGLTDYTAVQALTASLLAGYAPVVADAASIDFLNASGVNGAAKMKADSLSRNGYTVNKVGAAPSNYKNTRKYTIIDNSHGTKSSTLAMLKKDLDTTVTQENIPEGITTTADFIVILGDDSVSSQNKN